MGGPVAAPLDRHDANLRKSRRHRAQRACPAVAGGAAMLADAVRSYVAIRRAAGFAFRSEGVLLESFGAFSDTKGERYIRAPRAIEWPGLARSIPQRARRLGIVIRFARYLRAEDVAHEIPPAVFGAEKRSRPVPYILSPDQIRQLVEAASCSGYRTLRRETYHTLFALLACTGLRVSEAIHLCLADITPDGLVIRCSKFRKSRLVPLHDTARAGLERYLKARGAYAPAETHVFVSLRRKPSCCMTSRWPSGPRREPVDCHTGRRVIDRRLTRCAIPSR
jgi:integrase/recombinase XerD